MIRSKVGPVVTLLIVAGVAAILAFNREPSRTPGTPSREAAPAPAPAQGPTAGPREYPIGDEVVKNHMEIAAVWLPSVAMEGMPEPSSDVIHLEADIRSTADNPNG